MQKKFIFNLNDNNFEIFPKNLKFLDLSHNKIKKLLIIKKFDRSLLPTFGLFAHPLQGLPRDA